jgi:hypothetical protein
MQRRATACELVVVSGGALLERGWSHVVVSAPIDPSARPLRGEGWSSTSIGPGDRGAPRAPATVGCCAGPRPEPARRPAFLRRRLSHQVGELRSG